MHSPLLCALFLTVIRLIHGVEDVSFALVEGQREDQLDQTRLVRLQRRGEIDELKKSLEAIQGRLKELEQFESKEFFSVVDEDRDGEIEVSEIRAFVEQSVGGDAYDTESEISRGVNEAFSTFGRIDQISKVDFAERFKDLSTLMNVGEVAEWIEHSLLLPQYSSRFIEHSVTSLDFPTLLEDSLLSSEVFKELGIASNLHRQQIKRAIKMQLLGVGKHPSSPSNVISLQTSCNGIRLKWAPTIASGVMPAHKYVLQIRDDDAAMWETVHSGSQTMFTLTHLDPTLRYDFRVQAWNSVGPSEWAEVHNIKCGKEACNMLSLAQLASEVKQGIGTMMTYNKTNSRAPLVVMTPHSSLAVDSMGKQSEVDSGSVSVPIVDKTVEPAVSIFYTMYELFNSAAAVGSTISIVIAGILITRKVYISSGRGAHKPDGINAKELKNYSKIGQGCFICEKQFGTFTSRRHNCGKCRRLFCRDHGTVKCSVVCSIGGNCLCKFCESNPQGDKSSKDAPVSPPSQTNSKRPNSQSLSSLSRSSSSLSLKGAVTTVVASNRFRFMDVNRDKCPCGFHQAGLHRLPFWEPLHHGALLLKKMSYEKTYKERFVWITHNTHGQSCVIALHWSKATRKDIVNKVILLSEISGVVGGTPEKIFLKAKVDVDFEEKAFTVNHASLAKKSMDFVCNKAVEQTLWMEGIAKLITTTSCAKGGGNSSGGNTSPASN